MSDADVLARYPSTAIDQDNKEFYRGWLVADSKGLWFVDPAHQVLGRTSTGEQMAVAVTCPTCSEERGSPVYFGEGLDGGPVELIVPPETAVDHGGPKTSGRRLPRTIAVGLVGLSVIAYLATAYSWFNSSIWGGAAFFLLFAALAIAYKADDDAARRRQTRQHRAT